MDDLEERFVSAILGLMWGALLGALVVLFFNYNTFMVSAHIYNFLEWKGTIAGISMACGIAGFIFKASFGGAIGTMISWVWRGITQNFDENYLGNKAPWVKFLVSGLLALLLYWIVKE